MRKGWAVYILARLFAIYIRSCARSGKLLIDHSSRGKSYRKFIRTLCCMLCQLASTIVDVCAFRFLSLHSHRALLLSMFAKDRNVQFLAKANHYIVPFHTNTLCAYFHTFSSHLIQFTFFDFIQRLTWIWRCQIIISSLECINAYIASDTGQVSRSSYLFCSNGDTKSRPNKNRIFTIKYLIYALFLLQNSYRLTSLRLKRKMRKIVVRIVFVRRLYQFTILNTTKCL